MFPHPSRKSFMAIDYKMNAPVTARELATLFDASGIRRPTGDLERLQRMIDIANLTVTAWDGDKLVGVARALTDFAWCCYLSDLAVHGGYQKHGIGRELVERVKAEIGDEVALVLVSAPGAMGFYPRIGMQAVDNGWIRKRVK
jgi:GNAT superfamily N-acetyltransferase